MTHRATIEVVPGCEGENCYRIFIDGELYKDSFNISHFTKVQVNRMVPMLEARMERQSNAG